MSTSFTPIYIGGICKSCHTGELHQYKEDPQDQLRCGRCGEPDLKPFTITVDGEQATVTNVEEKPRTANRRKTV
jgi:hypothetical protein